MHDVGDYAVDGESRPLEPGMVLTIEPGLYFDASRAAPGAPAVPAHLDGIGIRIEDDVLVTEDGSEVLTAELPADVAAIEAMVTGARAP